MARGRLISDEVKREAVRLVDLGFTQKQAAAKLGIGYSTVYDAVRLARQKPKKDYIHAQKPIPEKIKIPKLVPGKMYTIREVVDEGSGKKGIIHRIQMRFLKKYTHHALFESKKRSTPVLPVLGFGKASGNISMSRKKIADI